MLASDIASAVRFLLTEVSSWITGQVLAVDAACPGSGSSPNVNHEPVEGRSHHFGQDDSAGTSTQARPHGVR